MLNHLKRYPNGRKAFYIDITRPKNGRYTPGTVEILNFGHWALGIDTTGAGHFHFIQVEFVFGSFFFVSILCPSAIHFFWSS